MQMIQKIAVYQKMICGRMIVIRPDFRFLLILLFSIGLLDPSFCFNQFSTRIYFQLSDTSDTTTTTSRGASASSSTTINGDVSTTTQVLDDGTTTNLKEKTNMLDEVLSTGDGDDDDSIFDIVAGYAASCLLENDKHRDAAKGDRNSNLISSSDSNNWINDENAFVLQNAIDRLKLKFAEERIGLDRDDASAWIRWMKSSVTPMIIDLSPEFRASANASMTNGANLEHSFFSRMGARLILLPSGSSLSRSLKEPPDSLIYGKLLYGGVTRYNVRYI
jgi:hypothetical protein